MKISRFISVISLLFICSVIYAQDTTKTKQREKPGFKRHEINVGFANILNSFSSNLPYLLYFDDYYYYDYYYYGPYPYHLYNDLFLTSFGIGYKYHFKNSAIRVYLDMGYNKSDYLDTDNNTYTYSNPTTTTRQGSYMTSSFTGRGGYEFQKKTKSTQFFFGADLFVQSSNYKWNEERKTKDDILFVTISNYSDDVKVNSLSYGFGPVLGIKYHFNELLSISTETRFDFSIFNDESTYNSKNIFTGTSNKDNRSGDGSKLKISPLGLFSLNVHL